jgi:antitoxin (DNA-binding transcriptional repressor) of toxin-antitoxin stability system
MKSRTVTATEFKARCLALIDEIAVSGETIVVTRHGKPVAQLAPPVRKPWTNPAGSWAGDIEIVGDIVNFDTTPMWNALKDEDVL